MELNWLLPLKFVKSIYSREKKTASLEAYSTGPSLYLHLSPLLSKRNVFAHWEGLVFFLRPPDGDYSGTRAIPAWAVMDGPVLEAEDRKSPAVSFCRDTQRQACGNTARRRAQAR